MLDRAPTPDDQNATRAEDLLASIIDLPLGEQQRAFEALCASHAALVTELREIFALHRRLLGPPDPSTSLGTERFGPYELLRPIGSGGMGTVWLARQQQEGAERLVALKMVRAAGLFSPDARERFRREARAMFRVEHPGICPIYDVGEVDGTPYLAMRFVPGRSLSELIAESREAKLALRIDTRSDDVGSSTLGSGRSGLRGRTDAVLVLIEAIARALHAAHESGLIHRDVKPGNVMVTPQGEPVLLDFGLARATGEASDISVAGAPLGTPTYMSPEQVAGRHGEIDRTTDVWSLAVTAYECLTLTTPFRADTREALYRRILSEPHEPLRRSNPAHSRDLDLVLATALQKEPARRYPTALAFAEDLAAVRRLQPTRARRATTVERTVLWARRNRAVSGLLVLLVVAAVTAVAFALAAQRRADEAEQSRQLAEDSFRSARDAMEQVVLIARDELAALPHTADERAKMFAAAIAFHRRFAAMRESDPKFTADVVRSWNFFLRNSKTTSQG